MSQHHLVGVRTLSLTATLICISDSTEALTEAHRRMQANVRVRCKLISWAWGHKVLSLSTQPYESSGSGLWTSQLTVVHDIRTNQIACLSTCLEQGACALWCLEIAKSSTFRETEEDTRSCIQHSVCRAIVEHNMRFMQDRVLATLSNRHGTVGKAVKEWWRTGGEWSKRRMRRCISAVRRERHYVIPKRQPCASL